MTPDEIDAVLAQGAAQGCGEALLCLGDKPEGAFGAYRTTLRSFGHATTVDYLAWTCERALAQGLLPHTNAGVLSRADMTRLRPLNASLGLMLESASERLCQPGFAHHRAPDKRPARRLAMLREAGELRIPFTTGILLGIGETPAERVEALLAIREVHRAHGHIQEVIVQNFRARPEIPMAESAEPTDDELARAIALARLILDPEVSVQAPPNLSPHATRTLIDAGVNDFGGISPVTRDYINHLHPWPHVGALRAECAAAGFALHPRLPVYPAYVRDEGGAPWVDPALRGAIARTEARITEAAL
jgi:FO synthase